MSSDTSWSSMISSAQSGGQARGAEAVHLNAYLEYATGDFDEAEIFLNKLIDERRSEAAYVFDLGLVHWAKNDMNGALAAFQSAAAIDPGFADAYYNAALAAISLDRRAEAAALFRSARRADWTLAFQRGADLIRGARGMRPRPLDRYGWRVASKELPAVRDAISYGLMRRGDCDGAIRQLNQALALEKTAKRYAALGTVYRRMNRFSDARQQFEAALRLDQNAHAAAEQIGDLLSGEQRYDEARQYYQTALARDPRAILSLAQILALDTIEGRLDAAQESHQRLAALLARIDLRSVDLVMLAKIAQQSAMGPLPLAQHRAIVAAIDQHLTTTARPLLRKMGGLLPTELGASERFRIGYLSSRFGDPSGYAATVALLAAHDRGKFEVHVFHPHRDTNAQSDAIAAVVEHFHRAVGPVPEVASFIRTRKLDLLIYLDGYDNADLLQIMSLSQAAQQVFWPGYASGCELSCINHVIADAVTVTPNEERGYNGQVLRLPHTIFCAPPRRIAQQITREAAGLPKAGMVFCAFSPPELVDRATFDSWMRILAAVDQGILWLTQGASASRVENLRAAAVARGIAPERLVFAERLDDEAQHMARHRLCAVFLDTHSRNAPMAALDALWSGLPVLTVRGSRVGARLTASCLHALGLEEMACASVADYESKAIKLAQDEPTCNELKQRVLAHRDSHPLFKVDAFCRDLEAAFTVVIERHRAANAAARPSKPTVESR